MSSAPFHSPYTSNLITPVEACRVLAGEVFRRERDVDNLRTGGLNSEKAVRQRLQSMAMELMRVPDLDDKIALHLYAIQWNDEDPLTILEKTESLVEKLRRERVAGAGTLLRGNDRVSDLAVRLLILQGIAGRVGRWAVRAGEIPDARTARSHYRDLEKPEWSSYCSLIEEANEAFAVGDHATVVSKIFDADRLVRTPASLVMAAVSLCRLGDFVGALWAIRTCLLEPLEAFESEAAHRKAKTLEQRVREIVEGRSCVPLDAEERRLVGADSGVVEAQPAPEGTPEISVGAADILAEEKEVLYAEPAKLSGEASPPPEREDDAWYEPGPVLAAVPKPHANGSKELRPTVVPGPELTGDLLVEPSPAVVPAPIPDAPGRRPTVVPEPTANADQPSRPALVVAPEPTEDAGQPSRPALVVAPEPTDDALQAPAPVRSVEPMMKDDVQAKLPTQPASLLHKRLVEQEKALLDDEFFQDTLLPRLPPTELEKARDVVAKAEEELRDEGRRLLRLVSETFDAAFPSPAPAGAEEETYVPAEPSAEAETPVPAEPSAEEETHVPGTGGAPVVREEGATGPAGVEPGRAKDLFELTDVALDLPRTIPPTERIIRRTIPASRPEPETDVLGAATLPMGPETRETVLASLGREEQAIEPPPEGRVALKRIHQVTHIVRPRSPRAPEPEMETEVVTSRSPLDQF